MTHEKRMMAARRSILRILPHSTLEQLSGYDQPHLYTFGELVLAAAEKWDLQEVHDAIEHVFRRADPEGTQQ